MTTGREVPRELRPEEDIVDIMAEEAVVDVGMGQTGGEEEKERKRGGTCCPLRTCAGQTASCRTSGT